MPQVKFFEEKPIEHVYYHVVEGDHLTPINVYDILEYSFILENQALDGYEFRESLKSLFYLAPCFWILSDTYRASICTPLFSFLRFL